MIPLQENDTLLILAPHPDDCILGGAGVMQEAIGLGVPVHIAYLTLGDFNEWSFVVYRKRPVLRPKQVLAMGEVRHQEALAAASLLGIPATNIHVLGYPDHGTLEIWYNHWGDAPPHHGTLTRADAVPYSAARRPGAPYLGQEILRDLTELLQEIQPTKILVSHPADQHPDHRAYYLYLRVALWDLDGELAPEVYPFLIHHPHWPEPPAYDPALPLAPPPELSEAATWLSHPLPPEHTAIKLSALQKHKSQFESNEDYLSRFIRSNELFSDFPLLSLSDTEGAVLHAPLSADTPHRRSEHLLEGEHRHFISVDQLAVHRDAGWLVFTLDYSQPFQRGADVSLYVFGFSPDAPFARMPKPHVQLRPQQTFLFDQSSHLVGTRIDIDRHHLNKVTVRIPLSVLHDPQKVLVEARSYHRRLPLDWTPSRVVALP